MVAGYFLLLAQKKVTKEKAPSAPRPRLRRGFATGGRVRPRGHPWPLGRIGAIPRAARVRCTRLFRPPFAAALEGTRKAKARAKAKIKVDSGFRRNDGRVGYMRCSLLRQGLPRFALYPGPSRPRRAGGG